MHVDDLKRQLFRGLMGLDDDGNERLMDTTDKEYATAEWVFVTPELAAEWLLKNTHNRPYRPRVASAYAADIRSGDWLRNGESIKFATGGALLDGQHRLGGVEEAGVGAWMLVVRGLPKTTQETMDGGIKRTFSDVLKLRGEIHYATLASIVRSVFSWERGDRGVRGGAAATNAQLFQTLEKYPWLRDGCTVAARTAVGSGLPAGIGGLVWWMTVQLDPEDAEGFFERLSSPDNHQTGEPIGELRKLLSKSEDVRGERSRRFLLAVSIKAWNKYRLGESVGLLKFTQGGAKPEQFPIPI